MESISTNWEDGENWIGLDYEYPYNIYVKWVVQLIKYLSYKKSQDYNNTFFLKKKAI